MNEFNLGPSGVRKTFIEFNDKNQTRMDPDHIIGYYKERDSKYLIQLNILGKKEEALYYDDEEIRDGDFMLLDETFC